MVARMEPISHHPKNRPSGLHNYTVEQLHKIQSSVWSSVWNSQLKTHLSPKKSSVRHHSPFTIFTLRELEMHHSLYKNFKNSKLTKYKLKKKFLFLSQHIIKKNIYEKTIKPNHLDFPWNKPLFFARINARPFKQNPDGCQCNSFANRKLRSIS